MRILSLLPSATEIVYALGLGEDIVGVTHECDWPPDARSKLRVSHSTIPTGTKPAEVDRMVTDSLDGGTPIYRLDDQAIREARPDLVITQDLCAVCAVPSGHVQEALDLLGCPAAVLSLDPSSLDEVLDSVLRVSEACGVRQRAEALVQQLRDRLAVVRERVSGRARPRVFALEWGDPPFNGGHWVPEMIDAAGGECLLGSHRTPSVRLSWDKIAAAEPDVVVFMPCGYALEAAIREGEALLGRPELAAVEQVFAVDASSYFARPGPRLVDGVEILATALHPDAVAPPPEGAIARLR
jgi:iron complex transport system substrate-binding protein